MASCGRHLNIWSKRWGNTDATGTSSGYQNISGDQLRLTTGQSRTYYDCPGSTINFTTTVANGVYLLRADLQTYAGSSGGGNGWNFGFKFNGTKVAGTDGTSGDTWQRAGHGDGDHVGCFSINRMYVVSPGLSAGTSVSANLMMGHWGADLYHNYPSYMCYSDFYVEEFAPS